jgi:hypothetical protein
MGHWSGTSPVGVMLDIGMFGCRTVIHVTTIVAAAGREI